MAPEELLKQLLSELQDSSPKAAAAAAEVLPEVRDILGGELVITWLDLIVSLSERSGAIAMKLCRESPVRPCTPIRP